MPDTEHFHVECDGPVFVISPIGNFGGCAGHYLPFEVDELLAEMERAGATQVILDLSETPFFGTPLLGALVQIRNHLASVGGEMAVCNVSETGREVLHVCHFEALWVTCDSRQVAKDALLSRARKLTVT
jgi:anti-anti-sigma factor